MSGDYTRMRYTPRSGYIGVLEQQGRVRLDADGNELVESIDRRRRAECIDTIGFAVFPTDPVNGVPTTNGFLIIDNAGAFSIGQGRGYVDGIQVDCWGADPQQFQPNLGESVGQNPLPYDNQPFFYSKGFPEIQAAGNSIVYLDVWEREVTALEDPGLIDPALGGIDTTTRIQAAWQVKAISTSASVCSDVDPGWNSIIAPSTGVLTSCTLPAPSGSSPCVIDPQSGYTGLENHLFRVQIYQSGAVDPSSGSAAATFVWSEDNASLGAAITAISPVIAGASSQISVATIGRDASFRFQVGDNLEVLTDYIEWSIRENKIGGQFVTVSKVDPEQLTLTVSADLSTWFAALPAGINPRLRKWDSAPRPTNNGTAISIGTEGAIVTFGPNPAGTLRAGDYWLFYARTATGKVEPLIQAPPRGMHHYAKLAVVNPNSNPPVQDCRALWPPAFGSEGCCTVVVNVGDDIQKAIDSLDPKIGGCVCLKAGVHVLPKTLSINGKHNIMFHGESIGAVVQGPEQRGVLSISESSDITVESIAFHGTATNPTTELVVLSSVSRCAFRHCVVSASYFERQGVAGFGFYISSKINESVEISDCVISDVLQGILATGGPTGLSLVRNQISGLEGISFSVGTIGIEVQSALGLVEIVGNRIADFSWGIWLVGSPSAPTNSHITGNWIARHFLVPEVPPLLQFTGALGTIIATKVFGILCDVGCLIEDNVIQSADPGHGGIIACGPDVVVERNKIISTVTPEDNTWSSLPVGIVVYQQEAVTAQHVRVVGNTLQGPQNGIAAIAEIADLIRFPEILDNYLDPGTSLVQQMDMTQQSTISQIELALLQLNTGPAPLPPAPFGILLINAYSANVVRNILADFTVGIAAIDLFNDQLLLNVPMRISLSGDLFARASLDGNEVDVCAVGILLYGVCQSSVRNGKLQDNTISMVLDSTLNSIAEGNTSADSGTNVLVHCYESSGIDVRLQDNTILNGATGILSCNSYTITIADNDVEGTNATGILVYSCTTEANALRNRVSGCGATAESKFEANAVGTLTPGSLAPWNFGTSVSAAIALIECTGLQSVEGCHPLNTGQVAGGQCADVVILNGAHARVRDCRIDRQSDAGIASVNSGIYVYSTLDILDYNNCGADVSGNYLNLKSAGKNLLAVDVENGRTYESAQSGILFNGNMVLQNGGGSVAVKLVADSLAITGNRIRPTIRGDYSLVIRYTSALSYAGNVVSTGQQINGVVTRSKGKVLPTPVNRFNVNA